MMKNIDFVNGWVVNLHFTDSCNYHCRFCHSHFCMAPLSLEDWKKIIDNIMTDIKVKRFNLAGGEPLTAPYIQTLIDYIHSVGVDCSIITNGSLLKADFIRANVDKISMIGISIDGLTHTDNLKIGRADTVGRTLSDERLIELADQIHDVGMILKVNTVVNAYNAASDFSDLIKKMRPERWKVLRMIAIRDVNDSGRDLLVTDRQFQMFVERHAALSPVVEDSDDIIHAYVIINPHGQIVDNSTGGYQMSNSLVTHPFMDEFSKIGINGTKYLKRYQPVA